jgi:hypothetical protein
VVAPAGETGLHRLAQPARGPGRSGHGERPGAAAELAVEDEERQPAEVVGVQVRNEHRRHLARIETQGPERGE